MHLMNVRLFTLAVLIGTAASAHALSTLPTVTGLNPNSGTPTGGTQVTITGSNFVTGATVTFDGIPATNVTFVNAAQITCTTPAHTAGAVNVSVTNPDTQNGTLANGFTYGGPVTVTSINPGDGTTNGGTQVTINGANFAFGATVTFGGAPATKVTFLSTTQLTCITPAHVGPATVDVIVTDSGTNSATLPSAFIYDPTPPPSIESVLPNSGSTKGGNTVVIDGTNFAPGATVTFSGVPASVTFNNPGQLACVVPPSATGASFANVTVTNPDSQSATLNGAYSYIVFPAPSVSKVVPARGTSNGGTSVTIKGNHFVSGATVTFGGSTATNVIFVNASTLTCTTPANTGRGGPVSVVVTNPDSQGGSLTNAFLYKLLHKPTIASVTPTTGPAAGGTAVTISGGHYVPGTTVTFGGVAAASLTFVSAKQLNCTTPPGNPGVVAVVITNPDGQSVTRYHAFVYGSVVPAPAVSSVSPNTGPSLGGTLVTIAGINFVNGATVTFGGVAATSVTFDSSSELRCITPAFSAGAVDVVVTNPDKQIGTLSGGYIYEPAP
jgi:hypothetical protein